MEKKLIIEIKYAGLGDHLFHSHLPKIAKKNGGYDKVFISSFSKIGHPDYKKIIWDMNPFVDGFVDEHGVICDIGDLVKNLHINSEYNLLDGIMFYFELNNGLKWNQPEIYYRPQFKHEYNYVIYDPNFVSWIGNVTDEDASIFFKSNNINFDFVMKLRGNKTMYIPKIHTKYIETPTLEDFCDLIFSAKKIYCLTSGTATLASALLKPAEVFYGVEQADGYKHYKKHKYVLIPRNLLNRIFRKLKQIIK